MALRAIPPRYAARFLPKPLLALTVPEQESPILPTVARPADASFLLEPAATAVSRLPPTFTPPPPPTPIPIPPAARIQNARHEFQTWNNCGPATLAMTLSVFSLNLTQKDTAPVLKPNPEDRNVSPSEMTAYVNERTDFQTLFRLETSRQDAAADPENALYWFNLGTAHNVLGDYESAATSALAQMETAVEN